MSERVLGLVGLGLLGSALAERFLKAGFTVHGYDLDPQRRHNFTQLGGCAGESTRAVAQLSNRLVLSLPTTDVVEGVLAEVTEHLPASAIIVDTTTGDPERTARIGQQLAVRAISYLDATIAGSSVQARAGDAIAMVGGEAAAVLACRDLLAASTREYFHVGPWGSGARMKLVVNLVLGLQRAVLAEGLAFAQRCGIDPQEALRVLRAGPTYSRVMDIKGQKMIEGDFSPQAKLSQHLKDVRLILEQARRSGANVPLSELHARLLEKVEALGWGDCDNAAILRAFV